MFNLQNKKTVWTNVQLHHCAGLKNKTAPSDKITQSRGNDHQWDGSSSVPWSHRPPPISFSSGDWGSCLVFLRNSGGDMISLWSRDRDTWPMHADAQHPSYVPQYNVELLELQVTEPHCRHELQSVSMSLVPCMARNLLGITDQTSV